MSVLPIRPFTDKILHTPCKYVEDFTGLDKIAEDMIETMHKNKGIGLAANQVGLDKNLCVMWLENKTKIVIVANLKNICYNNIEAIELEGCLSAPTINVPMKRFTEVQFDAQDILGNKVHYKLSGYDARIFSHEYQHLQGQMITDVINKL